MSTHGCLGKIGYATLAMAERAKRCFVRRKKDGQRLHSYHCGKCGNFHLGRWRRDGRELGKRTADHHAGSLKSRRAKYLELTGAK